MKTIQLTDIDIKEIRLARDGASYVISVLYAQTDDAGNEYRQQWSDPIKGDDLPSGIETFFEKVFTKVGDKIRILEGV